MHVIRNLSSLLLLFQFNGFIRLSADPLSKDFSQTGCRLNINENLVAFLDQSQAECGHSDLRHCTVIQDLVADILQVNAVTNVCLEQEFLTLVEPTMETVMVGLHEGCTYLHL